LPVPAKPPKAELPQLPFASRRAFAAWLAKHHAKSPGLWLALAKQDAKKDSGVQSVTYPEAVEVALCWGWIDGQGRALDASWWLQRFTPRGARSIWSRINRDRALRLIDDGAMKPPGLAAVRAAQADGRWEAAYEPPSKAVVPEDLRAALARDRPARTFFEALDGANRYAILFRLHGAKKPETRARRLQQFLEMLREGKTLHPRPVGRKPSR